MMNHKIKKNLGLALLMAMFSLQSCKESNSSTPTTVAAMPEAPKSITQLALASPDLSSLVAALTRAELTEVLNGAGTYTVFAPSNEAFATFLKANNFATVNDVPKEVLKNILLNHVLGQKVASKQIAAGYVKTLATDNTANKNNLSMYLDLTAGVKINGVSAVKTADIEASNGIIHKVDAVIGLPTVVTHATANPNFKSLVAALTRSDMPDFVGILSGNNNAPFTVFAPTDAAFGALLTEFRWTNLAAVPKDVLEKTLKYHVVAGANVRAKDLSNNQKVGTFLGQDFTIMLNPPKIVDANKREANIVATDVQCSNGIIHVLDKVIVPAL